MPLGNSQRCTRYVGRYLLKEFGNPIVLAMHEVERVFYTEWRDFCNEQPQLRIKRSLV